MGLVRGIEDLERLDRERERLGIAEFEIRGEPEDAREDQACGEQGKD